MLRFLKDRRTVIIRNLKLVIKINGEKKFIISCIILIFESHCLIKQCDINIINSLHRILSFYYYLREWILQVLLFITNIGYFMHTINCHKFILVDFIFLWNFLNSISWIIQKSDQFIFSIRLIIQIFNYSTYKEHFNSTYKGTYRLL